MPSVVRREVGVTGFGLMSLTPPVGAIPPKEQLFAALDAALATGANFWNGGQFYGTPEYNSLHLLRDYFTEYPEKADLVVLSIKGGVNIKAGKIPDSSEPFLRQSVDECLKILPPSLKKIDIFQCARVDPKVPIETAMGTLKKMMEEGKFGAVGLSEVRAETIRRANAIVPISSVEVEFSLFETSILRNGIAETCAELHIPVVAYSPLGRGILSGKVSSTSDIPAGLAILDKLSGDNANQNLRLIRALQKLAQQYHPHTLPQLAISWIRHLSGRNALPIIIPISGSSKADHVRANAVDVALSNDDLKKIDAVLEENKVVGQRSYAAQRQYIEG